MVAKYRPGMPVHVLTSYETTARQCQGVLKNIKATVMTSMMDTDAIVNELLDSLKKIGNVTVGDLVVVVHGTGNVGGSTNQMKILSIAGSLIKH